MINYFIEGITKSNKIYIKGKINRYKENEIDKKFA
jgi:hypothetical protein